MDSNQENQLQKVPVKIVLFIYNNLVSLKTSKTTILISFLFIVLISGINYIAVRFSNKELAPFWGASIRFTIASLLLFAVVFNKHLPFPKGRALVGVILYGLLGIGAGYAFTYLALVRIEAGLASVIMSMVPLITFILAFLQGLERFRLRTLFGAMLAIVGITIMFQNNLKINAPIPYLLLILGACLSIAEGGIIIKKFPKSDPLVTNSLALATGALVLFALAVITREPLLLPHNISTLFALFYLVLFGSIGLFMLYIFILSRWTASATSYMFVLSPLVAVPVGAWLAQETITTTFLISSLLVLTGVYIGAMAPFGKETLKK